MQERVGLPGHTRLERLLNQQVRETTEAIVGAVTGSLTTPRSLLLGRYDNHGRLQYTGRTTTLAQAASSAVAGLLASARRGHPWTGRPFCGRETLDVTLVEPELVVEVGVGVVRDTSGRWRDPARLQRARLGLSPGGVPRITALPRRHPSSTAPTSPGWLPARLQRVCGESAVGPGTVHGVRARRARGRVVGRRTGRRPSGGPVSARGPQAPLVEGEGGWGVAQAAPSEVVPDVRCSGLV
ncbi:hypothetical protein ACFWHF_34820 [Streptomyces griseoincarnatus]